MTKKLKLAVLHGDTVIGLRTTHHAYSHTAAFVALDEAACREWIDTYVHSKAFTDPKASEAQALLRLAGRKVGDLHPNGLRKVDQPELDAVAAIIEEAGEATVPALVELYRRKGADYEWNWCQRLAKPGVWSWHSTQALALKAIEQRRRNIPYVTWAALPVTILSEAADRSLRVALQRAETAQGAGERPGKAREADEELAALVARLAQGAEA